MEGFIAGRHNFNPVVIHESVRRRFGENAFLSAVASLYREVNQGTK
jgi:hypothetical protein